MTATDKLKRLAEAVAGEQYSVGSGGFVVNQNGRAVADFLPMPDPDDYKSAPTLSEALERARYFAAANPHAILALIAENERLKKQNLDRAVSLVEAILERDEAVALLREIEYKVSESVVKRISSFLPRIDAAE